MDDEPHPIVELNESLSLQAIAGGVVGFAVSYALDCNGIIEQVRCAACAAITALVLSAVRNFPRYHRKCNEWRGKFEASNQARPESENERPPDV